MSDRVLAIRPRALGDVVLVTPALRALARAFPGGLLEVVTERRYVPLLEGLEGVGRVWPLDRSGGATLALALSLRRRGFRLAVDFFGNPRSALLTAASGAETTAGFDLRGRRYAYRVRVPRDVAAPGGRREHASAAHLRLAVAVGGVPDDRGPQVALPAGVRERALALLRDAGVENPAATVGLVAAGSWPTKTWPLSHAAALARRLIAAGHPVLLLTGPGEDAVVRSVSRLAPRVHVLPPCGVGELGAVLERLALVVGTDSGPRHLAAALGTATFAWFGPTHPDTWQPPGPRHGYWWTSLPCRGCDRTRCPHWSCLPALDPSAMAARVLTHLEDIGGEAATLHSAAGA